MNIIFLGPNQWPQRKIVEYLTDDDNTIFQTHKKLNLSDIANGEYLISFGYRYKVELDILNHFNGKSINLHISYLPWNKGADPNLWSILEDTPKGVTIHQMNSDIDGGKILYQKKISFNDDDTLRTSYDSLQIALINLFKENWELIKNNDVVLKEQTGEGTYHKSSDKIIYQDLLKNGWDTKIRFLKGKAIND